MYGLKIWCDDKNIWRWTDVEWRSDEGQTKVEQTLGKKNGRTQNNNTPRMQNGNT